MSSQADSELESKALPKPDLATTWACLPSVSAPVELCSHLQCPYPAPHPSALLRHQLLESVCPLGPFLTQGPALMLSGVPVSPAAGSTPGTGLGHFPLYPCSFHGV